MEHTDMVPEQVGVDAAAVPLVNSAQNSTQKPRIKSSLRMKYEAEVLVMKRRIGTLEQMRGSLGLSQRKMCQLLMVDPSAWTRWTGENEDAPPHIYRMLSWYLALEDKYPALDVNFWLRTLAQVNEKDDVSDLRSRIAEIEKDYADRLAKLDQGLRSKIDSATMKSIDFTHDEPANSPVESVSVEPVVVTREIRVPVVEERVIVEKQPFSHAMIWLTTGMAIGAALVGSLMSQISRI